jgi:hypothetical protein
MTTCLDLKFVNLIKVEIKSGRSIFPEMVLSSSELWDLIDINQLVPSMGEIAQ